MLVVACAAALLLVAQLIGLLDVVRQPGRLRIFVDDAGALGPIVLVLLMTILVPLGVPGIPFVVAAGALWSVPVAVGASLLGGMTSSLIGIVVARRVGRDVLRERLPRWLAGLDGRLTRHGLWGVALLRVVLFLAAPADWLIGLSSLTLRTAMIGTTIGLLPPTIGYVVVGGELLGALATPAGLAWSAAGVVTVVAVVATLRLVRRRRRGEVSEATSPQP